MDTNENATKIAVHFDPINALNEFVIVPLADRFGITGEEVEERFDVEIIFVSTTEYDSIDGREGYRLRTDISEARLLEIIESSKEVALWLQPKQR